jgi:type II secretory pathway component PulM
MHNSILDIAPYAVSLLGAGIVLFLIIEMKRTLQEFQTKWNKRQQTVQSELGRLRGVIQQLETRLGDAEKLSASQAGADPKVTSINLNRRAQAIRLYRRGESPEKVAASMNLPRREAELLFKVHRILASEPSRDN